MNKKEGKANILKMPQMTKPALMERLEYIHTYTRICALFSVLETSLHVFTYKQQAVSRGNSLEHILFTVFKTFPCKTHFIFFCEGARQPAKQLQTF